MAEGTTARIHLVTGLYAAALTTATITLTFFALAEGLGLGQIALLTMLSALTQVVVRLPLGAALSRMTDRILIVVAVATLVLSMVVVLVLPGLVALVAGQVLLGASRAGFWSASQTHVVRLAPSAARGLSHNMLVTGLGNAIGPIFAGAATHVSSSAGAWMALALALACLVISLGLTRLPVFNPPSRPEAGRVGLRFGVLMASTGSFAAGVWHVSLTALAPAILSHEGWSEFAIGTVIAATNLVFLAGVLISGRARPERFMVVVLAGSALVASGVACLGLAGPFPFLAIVSLLGSGAGAGALMTLSPALATGSVHPEERGRAVVVTGTYRAGALLGAPLLVWAASLVLPIVTVMAVVGAVAGAPAIVAWVLRPRPPR